MAQGAVLRALRQRQDEDGAEREADALLVHRLPDLFSVRTGATLERSKVPLRKWAYAVYILATSIKSVPSTRLAGRIGVTQSTGWFMLHRLRQAWKPRRPMMRGTVEVTRPYFRSEERNKWVKSKLGRGPVGKTAVVGVKNLETKEVSS